MEAFDWLIRGGREEPEGRGPQRSRSQIFSSFLWDCANRLKLNFIASSGSCRAPPAASPSQQLANDHTDRGRNEGR